MEAAQKEEQIVLLQSYYEKMGVHCKKILQLFYYEEKKLEEIVHLLGYENKDVVKSQKSRCIKQLKTLIAEHNG
ncbi:RNA polymerase sigma factor [Sediminibacterium salmoneum]|uniref:RNA polymerase sigma factor n=1 Tax=Sediminibacterium salmoneum TaxID=426421 RepID=UPI00047BD497|nr:sigma-70 family RNA polymerase sigma factor [Sediminibacterium salmoneum]